MTDKPSAPPPDIRSHRLERDEIERNFADLHPPLATSEALIESDRCYFCYDAPCTTACPTDIDIPRFIQGIRSGNRRGAAQAILAENIMGGMCARVCPTEVLCEEACVRNTHEDQPVRIGQLQRYATEPVFDDELKLFERAADSGKQVAVVGGGPAGLSCAHRLSTLGHRVTVFNRDAKPGGLNEYGIAAYKTVDGFAQREVDSIVDIGGIELKNGIALGRDVTLAQLRADFDAVFIGAGLGGVNALGIDNEAVDGVVDAVRYIADLRQADDKCALPVGRRVVVIGGGMTAIDVAVQSKLLGADDVTIVYRRGEAQMNASTYEQQVAQTRGVTIRHWAAPRRILGDGYVTGIEFERTRADAGGKLSGTGDTYTLDTDIVFKAIGQNVAWDALGELHESVSVERGRIVVNDERRTSLPDVWAGGDCTLGGDDLTVTAVQDGKLAALSIDRFLRAD